MDPALDGVRSRVEVDCDALSVSGTAVEAVGQKHRVQRLRCSDGVATVVDDPRVLACPAAAAAARNCRRAGGAVARELVLSDAWIAVFVAQLAEVRVDPTLLRNRRQDNIDSDTAQCF